MVVIQWQLSQTWQKQVSLQVTYINKCTSAMNNGNITKPNSTILYYHTQYLAKMPKWYKWVPLYATANSQQNKSKNSSFTMIHNHFMAFWTLSGTNRVSRYQKVHFAIFWSKMKITQADAPTIWMDCHPIQTIWCPHLCHPHHFLCRMPFLTQPSQFILAWDRHQICWLAYPGKLEEEKESFSNEVFHWWVVYLRMKWLC